MSWVLRNTEKNISQNNLDFDLLFLKIFAKGSQPVIWVQCILSTKVLIYCIFKYFNQIFIPYSIHNNINDLNYSLTVWYLKCGPCYEQFNDWTSKYHLKTGLVRNSNLPPLYIWFDRPLGHKEFR
jgi:hypothetical protein